MNVPSFISFFISIPAGIIFILILVIFKSKKRKLIFGFIPFMVFLYLPFNLLNQSYTKWKYNNKIIPGNYQVYSSNESLKIELRLNNNHTYELLRNNRPIGDGQWKFILYYLPTLVLTNSDSTEYGYYEIFSNDEIEVGCGTKGIKSDSINYIMDKKKLSSLFCPPWSKVFFKKDT